jgi:hypothetical protein
MPVNKTKASGSLASVRSRLPTHQQITGMGGAANSARPALQLPDDNHDISWRSSPLAHRPDSYRMFLAQTNLFLFVPDDQAVPFAQRVLHLLESDFDFQCLAAVRQGKPKQSVVLRRTTGPE